MKGGEETQRVKETRGVMGWGLQTALKCTLPKGYHTGHWLS